MEGEVVLKKAGQEYAMVDRMLDNYNRCEATSIHSNRLLLCRVPAGKFRIAPGNIILVAGNGNDQQDEEFDVIHRYNEQELRLLVSYDGQAA